MNDEQLKEITRRLDDVISHLRCVWVLLILLLGQSCMHGEELVQRLTLDMQGPKTIPNTNAVIQVPVRISDLKAAQAEVETSEQWNIQVDAHQRAATWSPDDLSYISGDKSFRMPAQVSTGVVKTLPQPWIPVNSSFVEPTPLLIGDIMQVTEKGLLKITNMALVPLDSHSNVIVIPSRVTNKVTIRPSLSISKAAAHRTYLRTEFQPIPCAYCTNVHHWNAIETYQQGEVTITNVIDHPAAYQSPDPRAKSAMALPATMEHRSRMRPAPILPPLP